MTSGSWNGHPALARPAADTDPAAKIWHAPPNPSPRFYVKQKITLTVNRYQILEANPDVYPCELVGAPEGLPWRGASS